MANVSVEAGEVRPFWLIACLDLKRGSRRERSDMYRLLRATGSFLSRYLNRQTLGAYPHPAADLALMSQILKPADVVLVEGKRRISTAIKYLTQSSWSRNSQRSTSAGAAEWTQRAACAPLLKPIWNTAFAHFPSRNLKGCICVFAGLWDCRRRTRAKLLAMS